jgi:hypothetical protein
MLAPNTYHSKPNLLYIVGKMTHICGIKEIEKSAETVDVLLHVKGLENYGH